MEIPDDVLVALFTMAFAAWAGVVAWFGKNIRSDLKQTNAELLQYIIATEKRLAILETKMGLNNGKN